ncbi:MAG: flagellar filament capping protein FliD [Rhodoferax sp.]|uniref:flagellar filament capping protein FliD n=1 Tax=Rhodoferax sp. TaxID=50421 RepID=UPI0027184577|nr:flagellar filament capping protein FliD [Rhodoferax sp.]MDO8450748.1 flagellar filament capping protein FliD [Rhodoferax sp.]
MAISSTGVGSGLDVQSIVAQLVAIEKQPLKQLQTKASAFQTQLSLYGKIKSQASALGDAGALLAGASGWNTQKSSSSNAAAVGVTAGTSAVTGALSVEVQQLARAQSTASVGLAASAAVGASGNLNIELGSWSADAIPVFSVGTSVAVAIDPADTVSAIASKINAAGAGVTATVMRDGANERLVLRSNSTGVEAGFRVNTPADPGLAVLGITNPSDGVGFVGQTAQDAKVKINGVAVVSGANKMVDVVPGVTLQLNQVTTAPAEITVENDLDVVQKNIQGFVDAYNALNLTLADATKYTPGTKTGGPLQGDATTLGLQNALRSMLGSTSAGSTFSYLSDVGIERQTDGSLKINATKLTSAQQDLPNLKTLFAANNSDPLTNGFGLKVRDFSRGLVSFDGSVSNKSTALQGAISRNTKDQERVTERASRVEVQLLKQYSALDAQMAQLNGLNSYVTAQLAQWNKSTG